MKKALVIILALAFVLGMSAIAFAADPVYGPGEATFTEVAPEAGSGISTDTSGNGPTVYGASAWAYKDKWDASFKLEGSYRNFQNQTDTGANFQGNYGAGYYDFDTDTANASNGFINVDEYDAGPHDGYDTGSNKCKTCHAVHRAAGSYRLMRVDNPDDACAYCHVGDHKHSTRGAYYGDSDTVYPVNGHTMGAGQTIPDSTTKMWLQTKTIEQVNSDGTTQTVSFKVRQYKNDRNKLYYWTSYRSSYHDNGWVRQGPTFLSCISCHQPHNAQELVWKPSNTTTGFARGYKLLRAAPSGSTASTARMMQAATNSGTLSGYYIVDGTAAQGATTVNIAARGTITPLYAGDILHFADETNSFDEVVASYTKTATATATIVLENGLDFAVTGDKVAFEGAHVGLSAANIIKAPESLVNNTYGNAGDESVTTQNNKVTWTQYKGTSTFYAADTAKDGAAVPRFSIWCADCHNLNIGHYENVGSTGTNFRASNMHSDRTHTSTGRIMECWSCHTTNMPVSDADYTAYFDNTGVISDSAGLSCAKCHYYSNGATFYKNTRWDVAKSDFPHSGASTGYKLLTEATANTTGGVETSTTATGGSSPDLDKLCTRCHDLVNKKM